MTSPAITTGSAETESLKDGMYPRTIAILPFDNKTKSEFAYTVVRRTMANHFSTKNYRMLHWRDVDNRLALAGIANAGELAGRTPAELRVLLGVDGLVYGNITHYNKTFAAIYAQVAVGVELKFLNQSDEVIWEVVDVQRSHAGGVSTSPVGLIMNALVAAKHLYGDINLYRAADELGRDLAKQMPEPAGISQRKKPAIFNVVHSGVDQYLKYGDTLEVGIEGEPGLTAAAVIEGIGIIDLAEQEPGQYVGKVSLDKKLNLSDVVVSGRLQDEYGQTSTWISPYGLLNVDNEAPAAVGEVSVASSDYAVNVRWSAVSGSDVAGYEVAYATTETGMPVAAVTSANSNASLSELRNFEEIYVSVTTLDRAGNKSTATTVSATPAPDSRFSDATLLINTLPATITGVNKLTSKQSPYHLRSPARIASDGVLLIAPGVQIIVSPKAKLSVLGEIASFGNKEHPVTVRGDNNQTFDEFLVLQSSAPISLSGLNVQGSGIPIQITAGTPLLTDCVLADSAFNALSVSGSARPTIRNCTISGAKASGVLISGQAQPRFENNQFTNNDPFHIQNGSGYQVDTRKNSFEPAASNMTILGDVLY